MRTLYVYATRNGQTTRGLYYPNGNGLAIALAKDDFRTWVERNAGAHAASGSKQGACYGTPDGAWSMQILMRKPRNFRVTTWPKGVPIPE